METQLPADLSVAILAGGFGTRLRSAVADRPKVLAEVAGKPFLAWWLDRLEEQGARHVVFCTGYLADQVKSCFGSRYGRMELGYSVEPEPLGTGGSLRHALGQLRSEHVLVLNGDSFCEVDLVAFWMRHLARGTAASMVLTEVENTQRFGRVTLQPDWRITQFEEKGGNPAPGWINAGIYLLQRELLTVLPENQPLSLERDLLPGWLSAGVTGFAGSGRFIDIGTPKTYAAATEFFAAIA